MITPVAKVFPGALPSQHTAKGAPTVEVGAEGARAGVVVQSDAARRRHGDATARLRPALLTEVWRGGHPRAVDTAARRRGLRRLTPLIETLARLESESAGMRAAPFVVVVAGPEAAEARLGGGPLRPLPDAARRRAPLLALLCLGAYDPEAEGDQARFGVGTAEDALKLPPRAMAAVRVAAFLAERPEDAQVARKGPDRLEALFAGGGRLTLTLPDGAEATLLFARGASRVLGGGGTGVETGVDLRV